MREVVATVGVVALLLSACSAGGEPTGGQAGRPAPTASPPFPSATGAPRGGTDVSPAPPPSPSPGPSARPASAFVPPADEPVPRNPKGLAAALVTTTGELRRSIDRWLERADPATARPPRDVLLLALYQQRIYRTMGRRPSLARRSMGRLPKGLAEEARANTEAASNLFSMVRPISGSSTFRTGKPEPPGRLLRYYRQAKRRFGVDWEVLAALHHVETKFGRVRSASTAGAQGPMQFLPSTWAAYGMGGDIDDTRDAIMGAANYLRASGAPGDYRGALWAYNHAWPYVDAVQRYAEQMRRDPRAFFAYYSWQVFVLTTSGDRRLTGPRPRTAD